MEVVFNPAGGERGGVGWGGSLFGFKPACEELRQGGNICCPESERESDSDGWPGVRREACEMRAVVSTLRSGTRGDVA